MHPKRWTLGLDIIALGNESHVCTECWGTDRCFCGDPEKPVTICKCGWLLVACKCDQHDFRMEEGSFGIGDLPGSDEEPYEGEMDV